MVVPAGNEEAAMNLSDELLRLSQRAKRAEDDVATAVNQATDQLEKDVEQAGRSMRETLDKFDADTAAASADLEAAGSEIQQSWNEHIAQVRTRIDARKARHEAKVAERNAEDAEQYAAFAIRLAYSAIEEAEYAALDAILTRGQADAAGAAVG
jgi:membrane-associated HD superfamily phosphohydrolase